MTAISTLAKDIYEIANNGMPASNQNADSDKMLVEYATRMGEFMGKKAYADDRGTKDKSDLTIRMSELGTPCVRQLLFKWFNPEFGKPPYTYKPDPALGVKFGYGYLVEEFVLSLAQLSGHKVEGQQRQVKYHPPGSTWHLTGSIDAIIDDYVVDVKSMSKFAFDKYRREGFTEQNDSFGYSWQLNGYGYALAQEEGAHRETTFVMVEKETGRIELGTPRTLNMGDLNKRVSTIADAAENLKRHGIYPAKLKTKPHKYGEALDVVCSYCAFKHACYKDIHTYVEKTTPTHLVKLTPMGESFVKANAAQIWHKPEAVISPKP